jgi:hypothetical protein
MKGASNEAKTSLYDSDAICHRPVLGFDFRLIERGRSFPFSPLRRAHIALDKAVDRLYRRAPFAFERERVEHLFELYERAAAPLAPTAKPKGRRTK